MNGEEQINNLISNIKANAIDGIKHYGTQALNKGGGMLKTLATKAGDYLDSHDNFATRFVNKHIDTNGQGLAGMAANKVDGWIKSGQEGLEKKGGEWLKDKAQKVGIGALIATAANPINNMTNQENMTSNNPSILQKVLNSLKSMYDRLMGHKENAPAQQQSVIQNLLNKAQNGMKSIEAKLKLVGGQK